MAKRQSLGRGFETLIPKDLDKSLLQDEQQRIQKLLIEEVEPNPDQPRREIDDTMLGELADSISRHGVLQPIIVVRNEAANGYTIVAGERRWRASKLAKQTHIPAIVRSLKELEKIELSLIENIQRVDLSPLEQSLSLYKLQHQFNMTLEEVAKKLGKAPSTISNLIRLLQLPDSARDALNSGKISEGHARAILALKHSPHLQEQLLKSILDNGWTVRQAEQFVKDSRDGVAQKIVSDLTSLQTQFVTTMSSKLEVPVQIKRGSRGGKIVIKFRSDDELRAISDKLNH